MGGYCLRFCSPARRFCWGFFHHEGSRVISGEFVLVTPVHVTQQTWRCSWSLQPSPNGTGSLTAMLHGPRELRDPTAGLGRAPRPQGISSMAAPAPAQARGELGPSMIPVISTQSRSLAPPSPSPCAGVWIPTADGLCFTHGLIWMPREGSTSCPRRPCSKEPNSFAGRFAWMRNACL